MSSKYAWYQSETTSGRAPGSLSSVVDPYRRGSSLSAQVRRQTYPALRGLLGETVLRPGDREVDLALANRGVARTRDDPVPGGVR